MAAKVEQKVAGAATEFTWRQQLFTHLADEIGWPLRIDDAQQRSGCASFTRVAIIMYCEEAVMAKFFLTLCVGHIVIPKVTFRNGCKACQVIAACSVQYCGQ